MAEYLFDKHTLGNRDEESQASSAWLPIATGLMSLVTKAVRAYLYCTFAISCTKMSTQVLSLVPFPQIKELVPLPPKGRSDWFFCSKWMCNWEGLILNPFWLCFCDVNSYFAAFDIIGILSGLPRGALPAPPPLPGPWARMPLLGSQGDSLTLWRTVTFLSSLCGKWRPQSAAYWSGSEVHIWRAGIADSCGIFVCWYNSRYSISYHQWNDCKEMKLTHPPAWGLPF